MLSKIAKFLPVADRRSLRLASKDLGDMPELTGIGDGAFEQTPLKHIGDMPKLKTIGDRAFTHTQLAQLGKMPSLTTIGERAFYGTQLQKIFLPKSLQTVRYDAFKGCPLEKLSVETGAKFKCYCENLASKLRLLKGVDVDGDRVWTFAHWQT